MTGDQSADVGLAARVEAIEETQIRVMFDLAEERGGDLVRLEVGEPDFDTPDHIIDAATEAAKAGATHYTSNAGLPELREAIAGKMHDHNDVSVDPASGIVVTNGGMEALFLGLASVVDPGEEVLIPTPAWPNYTGQARTLGADVTYAPLDPDTGFSLDPARVTDHLSDRTSAVILNTPCNPTGRVYDDDAVREVVAAAADHDAYVLADEVYEGLIYEGSPRGMASYVDHPDRVLTVNGCSKKYAMTGWRLGWLAGDPDVVGAATKLHQSTTSCASSVSQHAALEALTGDQEPIEGMKEEFRKRRDYVVERIEGIPGISAPRPEGSFYAFLDVSVFEGSTVDVAKRLLDEYGVVTAPGEGFGDVGNGYLRISFATSIAELERGFDRIAEMVKDEARN